MGGLAFAPLELLWEVHPWLKEVLGSSLSSGSSVVSKMVPMPSIVLAYVEERPVVECSAGLKQMIGPAANRRLWSLEVEERKQRQVVAPKSFSVVNVISAVGRQISGAEGEDAQMIVGQDTVKMKSVNIVNQRLCILSQYDRYLKR